MYEAIKLMVLMPNFLFKPSISKAQLSVWLFTTIYMRLQYYFAVLSCSRDVKLLNDKDIYVQKKIIGLQDRQIDRNKEE